MRPNVLWVWVTVALSSHALKDLLVTRKDREISDAQMRNVQYVVATI